MLSNQNKSLTERLSDIHNAILEGVPGIDRISCALHDRDTDLLKTFINSTQDGQSLQHYEYPLHKSQSLQSLVTRAQNRELSCIAADIKPTNTHSQWLLNQGYQSSFTVPMFSGQHFLGFIFFDSKQEGAFSCTVQRDLLLYCNLITMAIASEMSAVSSLVSTAKAIQQFARLRDFETGAHLSRMAKLARLIAQELAHELNLSDEYIEHIHLFAPLHDIGKIGIPDEVLLKPGKFTHEERLIMQQHVNKGVDILRSVLDSYQLSHLVDSRIMLNIVAYHHELLDGSGYPNGLRGDEIPLEARIITTADIFDALTSMRPYKDCWMVDDALAELQRMVEAGKLDSRCVQALMRQKAQALTITKTWVDVETVSPTSPDVISINSDKT